MIGTRVHQPENPLVGNPNRHERPRHFAPVSGSRFVDGVRIDPRKGWGLGALHGGGCPLTHADQFDVVLARCSQDLGVDNALAM